MPIFLGSKNRKREIDKLLFLLLLSCFVLLAIQIIPVLLDPPERRVGGASQLQSLPKSNHLHTN
jgi:hypothetical protein